jgi:peptidyl-prolyl cis-trans isomerase D
VKEYLAKQPESELKAYYDSRRKDFTEPANVMLRQIRVAIPFQATAQVKEAAKAKIEKIAKEISGDNFAAVAKKNSDDEYAKKGGTVGWVKRGTLEPALEKAIDALEKGKVSTPIETSFGYYLLEVQDQKPQVVKSFEDVKHTIASNLATEKKRKGFTEKKREEWDKKLVLGQPIESDLKAQKIEIKKSGMFSLGQGYIPNLGEVDAVIDGLFKASLDKPVLPKLIPHQEHFYWVKLVKVQTPKDADFAKAKASVGSNFEASLQRDYFDKWIADLKTKATITTQLKF